MCVCVGGGRDGRALRGAAAQPERPGRGREGRTPAARGGTGPTGGGGGLLAGPAAGHPVRHAPQLLPRRRAVTRSGARAPAGPVPGRRVSPLPAPGPARPASDCRSIRPGRGRPAGGPARWDRGLAHRGQTRAGSCWPSAAARWSGAARPRGRFKSSWHSWSRFLKNPLAFTPLCANIRPGPAGAGPGRARIESLWLLT